MPSDTPSNIIDHVDLLLPGECQHMISKIKCMNYKMHDLNGNTQL